MIHHDYRVQLDAFEGPLDLLLFLIRKNEVDIHDIPVALITQQYLEHLHALMDPTGSSAVDDAPAAATPVGVPRAKRSRSSASSEPPPLVPGIERVDIDEAGEFLVMAATLMEIKSRMLAPIVPEAGGGHEAAGADRADGGASRAGAPAPDPRAELVGRLLEYKRLRDAAHALEQRHAQWQGRRPSAAAAEPASNDDPTDDAARDQADGSPGDAPVELDDLQLTDLVAAFARIISTVDLNRVGDHRVLDDETPIHLHARDILERLSRDAGPQGRMVFAELFAGRTRSEAIGLFVALLELVRQKQIRVTQDQTGPAGTTILIERQEGQNLEGQTLEGAAAPALSAAPSTNPAPAPNAG
jgi:segregation and condensation protein A